MSRTDRNNGGGSGNSKALRESIGQRVGPGRVEVWRDKRRLAGNELFDEQIKQQLDRSAILVTVLSQHYLSSTYCKKEFVAFGRRHLEKGDLHVDHLSRIVKVYRRAIERAELRRFVDLPALIRDVDRTVGYELFYKDDEGIDRDVLLDPGKSGLNGSVPTISPMRLNGSSPRIRRR